MPDDAPTDGVPSDNDPTDNDPTDNDPTDRVPTDRVPTDRVPTANDPSDGMPPDPFGEEPLTDSVAEADSADPLRPRPDTPWHPSQGGTAANPPPGGGQGDPFAALGFLGPMFADLSKMLSAQGGGPSMRWTTAKQIATWSANEGQSEANVDPIERIRLEQLARVAQMHVEEIGGLEVSGGGQGIGIAAVTRSTWATVFLDEHQSLLDSLSTMTISADLGEPGAANDPQALLSGLLGMVQPALVGMQVGSMAGHLSRRSFASYDLPLPRSAGDQIFVVPINLDTFAREWSLDGDALRMRVLLGELAHHAVLRVPHVREHLSSLLRRYASSYHIDVTDFEERIGSAMGGVDPNDPSALIAAFGNPEAMIESATTAAQRTMMAEIASVLTVIEGWTGHVVAQATTRVLGEDRQAREALRRRRVTAAGGDRMVERMLGLSLDQPLFDTGKAFIDGVVERAGDAALARLWTAIDRLPTANELAAPGLWLARIDL